MAKSYVQTEQKRTKKEKSPRAMTVSFIKCKNPCESPETGGLCGLCFALHSSPFEACILTG